MLWAKEEGVREADGGKKKCIAFTSWKRDKWKWKQNPATLISKHLDEELSVTCDMFNMHMNSHFKQYSHLKYCDFYKSNKIMMKHFPKKREFLAPKIIDRCKPRETYKKSNNLVQCRIFLLSKVGFWSGRVEKKIPDVEDGPQFLSCQKSFSELFNGLNN